MRNVLANVMQRVVIKLLTNQSWPINCEQFSYNSNSYNKNDRITFLNPISERVDDVKPAWSGTKTFLVMLLAALVIIALAIAGITYYKDQQENARKRFYWFHKITMDIVFEVAKGVGLIAMKKKFFSLLLFLCFVNNFL